MKHLPAIDGLRAMQYIPGLDGLRTLAVLAVVCCHSGAGWARGGFIGVDVFFVLSGYLITRLLAETQPTLRQFYIRRLRRLTPPLAVMLAVYLTVFYVVVPNYPHYIEAGLSILYLSDYAKTFWAMPDYLGHTWSLAVEEHFYLLWPLVFYRFRPSVKALAWGFVAATVWRLQAHGWDAFYTRFDMRLSGLVLGCLLAHFPRQKFPAWPALVALAFVAFYLPWKGEYAQGPGITTVEIAAAFAIMGEHPAWLESRVMTYLGKLSYGIYLWHYPIARLLDGQSWQLVLSVTLVASIALAALSYHTIEAWVRRPKLQPLMDT
jgi:peptidoglycan/LPS O-acetylase OafA/YrhL